MEFIWEIIFGFIIGWWFWNMLLKPLRDNNTTDTVEMCKQHQWVMDNINSDLHCSVCGKTVEELKWSDKQYE